MRARRALLGLVVLAANAVILAVEMLATRLLFPVYGNTVFVWSAVISIIIAGLFLGYLLGGWAADRSKNRAALVFGELLAGGLLVAVIPTLADAFLLRSAVSATPPLASCLIVFGLPAALLAAIPPAVVALYAAEGVSPALASGAVSGLSAAGSIAGSLWTTFSLIPAYGVRSLFAGLGLGLGLCALLLLWAARVSGRGKAAGALLVYGVLLGMAARANARSGTLLAAPPVFSKDSLYQLVRVFEQRQGSALMRVMMLDSTHEGAMRLDTQETVFEYTRAYRLLVGALRKDAPARVLFIGGGAYTMPIKTAQGLPLARVEVAEIDPVVAEAGARWFGARAQANVESLISDGRRALRGRDAAYDAVFIDAYQGVMAIPFHLTTREFFSEVGRALKPGGFVSMNVIGDVLEKEGFFCSMLATVGAAYPAVRVYPVAGLVGGAQNVIIAAGPRPEAVPLWDAALSGTGFSAGMQPDQFPCRRRMVLTDDHAPVEWLVARYLNR